MGWTKGLELAKLSRKQGQRFESATWLHKAQHMPKAEFQQEIEKALHGVDSEPSDLIYFKVYKSQIPVIEHDLPPIFSPEIMRLSPVFVRLHQRYA